MSVVTAIDESLSRVIGGNGSGSDDREQQQTTGARPPQPDEELIRVHTGDWSPSPFSERPTTAGDQRREFDLAVREAELKRRESALKRIERAIALTPVPARYFDRGHNEHENDWWAQQLGRA
jgi:hypothetical protein